MKKCSKCKQLKQLNSFSLKRKEKDGLNNHCRECVAAYAKARDKKYVTDTRLKYLYGISLEIYEEILSSQDYRCAVCSVTLGVKAAVDHDHTCCPGEKSCGKCIRGILCISCNVGLGMFKDNYNILLGAVRYLRQNSLEIDIVEEYLEEIDLSYSPI